jgi:phosphoribosylamine--glycine ligase
MDIMNVLVIGAGGREHALAWKIAQSPLLDQLFIAPGNAGTEKLGENVSLNADDFEAIAAFIRSKNIGVLVVGPEDPLVKGLTDFMKSQKDLSSLIVVGPASSGAMLEGSKEYAKEFMKRHNIPTASYDSFTADKLGDGKKFLQSLKPPYVLKADGLAAGKGVLILDDLQEAEEELEAMLNGKFGAASEKVVIEEFLSGIELSVFVLTDGVNYHLLPEAKDYKRIGEGDTGLNTGGMGAVSPVPFADKEFMKKVVDRIVEPTVKGLQQDDIDYQGFIFFGLIKVNNDPFVIEYNVRMGDPESEVVIPRIQTDLLELFSTMGTKKFGDMQVDFSKEAATTLMLVSGGYPGTYDKGIEISGLDNVKETIVFHAGTKSSDGNVLTNGGRVIALTSLNESWRDALGMSYESAKEVNFDGMYFRKDIGFDL